MYASLDFGRKYACCFLLVRIKEGPYMHKGFGKEHIEVIRTVRQEIDLQRLI